MNDRDFKSMKEMAEEVIRQLGEGLDAELEHQLRALHARDGVRVVTMGVVMLALGHATLRGLEFSPAAYQALVAAAAVLATRIKTIPAERAAELTDEERAVARKLGARIPRIGKA